MIMRDNQPLMEYKVSQGVTTVVTGNCGLSTPPKIDKYPSRSCL